MFGKLKIPKESHSKLSHTNFYLAKIQMTYHNFTVSIRLFLAKVSFGMFFAGNCKEIRKRVEVL